VALVLDVPERAKQPLTDGINSCCTTYNVLPIGKDMHSIVIGWPLPGTTFPFASKPTHHAEMSDNNRNVFALVSIIALVSPKGDQSSAQTIRLHCFAALAMMVMGELLIGAGDASKREGWNSRHCEPGE
jgi:hypothetical protein